MLTRPLRYLVTLTALLATPLAGLPFMLCVSDAHGTAIEVAHQHSNIDARRTAHSSLIARIAKSAQSEPCNDYELQSALIIKQKRDRQPSAAVNVSSGNTSFLAASALDFRQTNATMVAQRQFAIDPRSSLTDLRTVVLLI
jgi:hypothetical protein